MKMLAISLILCLVPASAAKATIQSYAYTGVVTEVQGNLSQTLQNMGVGAGDKIFGTVTFDDSAPIEVDDPSGDTGQYSTGLNMSTTFYVLGSPINFNSGPTSGDQFFLGNFHDLSDTFTDSFGFQRENGVVPGIPDGFNSPAGFPVHSWQLKVQISNVLNTTINSNWLSLFDVNLPNITSPPKSTQFQLGGSDFHVASFTLLGQINSFVPIPEPSTLALACIGGLALLASAGRRRSS